MQRKNLGPKSHVSGGPPQKGDTPRKTEPQKDGAKKIRGGGVKRKMCPEENLEDRQNIGGGSKAASDTKDKTVSRTAAGGSAPQKQRRLGVSWQ